MSTAAFAESPSSEPVSLESALPRSVLVVGSGLLGTSLGLALRRRGVTVHLHDRDPRQAEIAAQLGAGVAGPPAGRVDLAVTAVPPAAVGGVVCDLLARDVARFVTDVASVKVLPRDEIRARGAASHRYVGGHPMAGREVSGPAAARVDLFRGRTWVLCPEPETDPAATAIVHAVAEAVGAVPVVMAAEEHDSAVALVSHAPHVMATLIAAQLTAAPDTQVRLAGQGIADVTRVAAGDPALWTQILEANAGAVRDVLLAVRQDLDRLVDALAGPAGPAREHEVTQLLEAGVHGQARLPGKHGASHVDYALVVVTIEDRPGQLARLFSDVDAIEANIEDIRIEHSPGQPIGFVQLAVRPGAHDVLANGLESRGWSVLDQTRPPSPTAPRRTAGGRSAAER